MEKLNRLEREYLVLTHTQSKAEVRTKMDPSVPSLALLKPEQECFLVFVYVSLQ